MSDRKPAYLLLEDGSRFEGYAAGAESPVTGEVVFNTSMSGYQEALTDPSYRGQIITYTYPMVGNYGVGEPFMESDAPHARAVVMREIAPSGTTGIQGDWERWLVEQGVPADSVIPIGKGSDTLESLELVAQVFEERGWRTAVIVSDPWHSLRSREIAEDFGIEAATSPARSGPAVLERETQLWYITRETASLWHYWIFGESAAVRVDAL